MVEICQVRDHFEALDEVILTGPSVLSCIFYHLYIAIGTICLESDRNTIKNFDEKPFSTEKYEQ